MAKVEAAERFEVLAGDLIHRVRLVERRDPKVFLEHVGQDVLDATRRLELAVQEHACDVAKPLGDEAALLLERQAEMIAAQRKELDALRAALVRVERINEEVIAEYSAWRRREVAPGVVREGRTVAAPVTAEHAVLKAEAAAELRAYKGSP